MVRILVIREGSPDHDRHMEGVVLDLRTRNPHTDLLLNEIRHAADLAERFYIAEGVGKARELRKQDFPRY